jgi:ABC-type amino acid transport system permease subunit
VVEQLLIGLPNDRPGGLVLTVLVFLAAAGGAVVFGFAYAAVCVALPRASLALQAGAAALRGVPVLLLVFFAAQLTALPVVIAGLVALVLYSFAHVGEILRSFLAAYPSECAQQARAMGIGAVREWLQLRAPRTLGYALGALVTHWISLLKDTGALVVLGIGELTTVAKVLAEGDPSFGAWATVLLTAAGLYLATTLALIQLFHLVRRRPFAAAVPTA